MNVRFAMAGILLAAAGCKGKEDTAASCTAQITDSIPADGAGPVARTSSLVVDFTGTADAATLQFTDADGNVLAGDVALAEGQATLTPREPLPADATITWEASICGSTSSGTFTTGTIQNAVDPTTSAGDTFAVDLANANWISPPDGGALVQQVFAGAFLIGVQSMDSGDLDCIGAAGEPTEGGSFQQDPCYATLDFDPVDFASNPYFSLQADRLEFTVGQLTAIIHGSTIAGGIDGDRIIDGTFSGEADLRDYSGITCAQTTMFGIDCVACRSDGEVQCIWLEADQVEGDKVPGLTLVANDTPAECNTGG